MNGMPLGPLYLIAAVMCILAFVFGHKWFFLPLAGLWLALAVFYFVKDRNDDSL